MRRLCSGRAALARVLLAGLVLAGLAGSGAAHATSLRYCDGPAKLSAAQQDRLLRVSAIIKAELEQSGAPLALVARSGLNLGLFGMRYSHAGLSLKAGPGTPWSVRQLYYACEDQQPRLFDQGMSAFLLGMDEPSLGFVSVVTLPAEAAAALVPVAMDNQQVLQLLAPTYSANAYAFSVRYQNCNQWLAELLAAAWGSLPADADPRPAAQGWLKAQGYQATVFQLPFRPALWLTAFSPWLHRDDHPDEDLEQALFRVSMPASIETFVRARLPGAQRLEFCHTERHVVVRRGWDLIADGCVPGEQDQVILLQ